jgi:RNA polymerase sigma-70 factor (ECF subfamily)
MDGGADESSILTSAKHPDERQRILADIFMGHRDRLGSMVRFRLDRRLRARVDPSDILQDAFLEASGRIAEYIANPSLPVYLWLRGITAQKLLQVHRFHLDAQKRSPRREVSFHQGLPFATSEVLAENLVGHGPSAGSAAAVADLKAHLQDALDRMDEKDREVVALRHFEELTNAEAARVLGIEEEAAKKRYIRAIRKLREILERRAEFRGET